MEKDKIIQRDYSTYPSNYQLKIASETDILIGVDDSVRLLNEVMEDLDYTELYRTYSPKGRNPKTSPAATFKVMIYGSME